MRVRNGFTKIIAFVCMSFLLVACAGLGGGLDEESLSTLKKGVTTKAEIEKKFGKPDMKQVDSSGESIWTYHNATDMANAGVLTSLAMSAAPAMAMVPGVGLLAAAAPMAMTDSSKVLIVTFNKKGVVSDYSYSE